MTALKALAAGLGLLVLGNLAILAASAWARGTAPAPALSAIEGIDNLRRVDAEVWRGAAPTAAGYRGLAGAGVTTVVDLRAEEGIEADFDTVRALGMDLVHIPIRDGQVPTPDEVSAFLTAAGRAPGLVFVHCGAGVGRTGAMVGAYRIARGEVDGSRALRDNLAVGPPSLEQIFFVAGLDGYEVKRPGAVLTATSRVLDAPRRLWSRIS